MCPEVKLKKPTHKERAVQQDQRVPDNHGLLEVQGFLLPKVWCSVPTPSLGSEDCCARQFPHTHTLMLYGITRSCNSHPSPPSEVERDSVGVWTSSTVSYKEYSNLPCRTAWVKDAQSMKSKWNPGPHTKMHRFLCRSEAWKCLHLCRRHRLRNWRSWGWRDVWVVKSICCSTRGLEFISQSPYQMARNQL